MRVREPIVADRFYPGDPHACRRAVRACLDAAPDDRPQSTGTPPADGTSGAPDARPASVADDRADVGGVVPHAGWMCSGRVAGRVFARLARARHPDVVVLFGGVHRYRGREAALFGAGRWETPIGSLSVEARLCERLLGLTNLIVDDPYAHEQEHSIEVQLPFIVELFPDASIVPIMVPPAASAPDVGQAVARTIDAYRYDALILGTTDLTHYGPSYGFTPRGIGRDANRWAKDNDRPFIERVGALDAAGLVAEASAHHNACNAGAAAAAIAASTALGATTASLLDHTTSAEVLGGDPSDSVGYAGWVLSRGC